jgi:hypothetical protein
MTSIARRTGPPRLKIVAVALALLATGGPASFAENDGDALRFPHLERLRSQRARQPVARAPRAPAVRDYSVRRENPRRSPVYLASPVALAPQAQQVEPTFFVAVLGDAFGLMLADGLRESLAPDRPHVGVLRKARDSSGLVREDFFDWRKAAREIASGAERVDHAVIMLGANDRQALRDADGTTLEPLTPRWREIYGQRIEEIVGAFRARSIPVIWVGLPIMRSERYGADIAQLNELFRVHAEAAGASYVDVWERFADESGQFAAAGPDVNGQPARLRAADGIHLTRAGSVKLAYFVQGDIARAAGAAPVVAAAPPPQKAEPALIDPFALDATRLVQDALKREEEAREAASRFAGLAAPEAPGPLFLPTRPVAGPVVSLTAPALSPGGALDSSPAALRGGDASATLTRVLVEGRPQEARPGRGDDFAWPRR